ncbi:MAG: ABC transporter substrate-binding protein [Woeseiaceae bacterium]|nr:ABC transporter substrate-binding protein [Woeseiaceae bacterium]
MRSLLVTLLATFAVSGTAAAQSPNDLIDEAIVELTAGLDGRRDELSDDRAALHALIDEILLPRFDRRYAAQLVLGQHWRAASAEQRERFVDAFYNAMLRQYADGVLEFQPDRIEVLPFRGDDTGRRTTVRTMVMLDDGQRVPVNYGLVKRDEGWLMFDVTIEGVSYVRNFRAELDSEIRAGSLDSTIARFEREAEESDEGESDGDSGDAGQNAE